MRTGILLLAMLAFAGCGSDRPALAPVEGTVTYRGKPLEKGTIQLIPAAGRSANGRIENGRIEEVSTFDRNDGALIGEHRVAIYSFVGNPTGMEPNIQWAIPKRFGNAETSGLKAEVSPDHPNNLSIELRD